MKATKRPVSVPSRTPVKSLILLLAIAVGAVTMTACSTTEGFGEDVKHLGGSIENSAERNK